MNVNSWLRKAKKSVDSLDAELILLEALGFSDRSELVSHDTRELGSRELELADEMLTKRKEGMPLAYVLGYKEFYGRTFVVNSNTLIPRPETENCIWMILSRTASGKSVATDLPALGLGLPPYARPSKDHPNTILDIGTGSGCIGATLALEIPESKVVAIDVSEEALEVARENASRLGAENIEFQQGDLLKNYAGPRPDIIVANLPYVDREWDWLSPELAAEPDLALYADNQGLALIYRLLDEINQKWYNSKHDTYCTVYLEADPCQHPQIISYATSLHFQYLATKDYILQFSI